MKQDIPLGHLLTLVNTQPLCITGARGIVHLIRYLVQYPIVEDSGAVNHAWPICRRTVLRQHPWLQEITPPPAEPGGAVDIRTWCWLDQAEQTWCAVASTTPATDEDWAACGLYRPRYTGPDGKPCTIAFTDPVISYV